MKKIIAGISLVLLVAAGFLLYKTLQVPTMPVHYHANFAVFIDDKQVEFSDPDHMSLKPCKTNEEPSLNKLDNVHLHDNVGNVVHLHQDGITWQDFFTSVQYDLQKQINDGNTKNESTKIYLNGKLTSNEILSNVIGKNDQLVIVTDSSAAVPTIAENQKLQEYAQKAGTNAHEYDEEKKGESCSGTQPYSLLTRFKIAIKKL